MVKFKDLEDHAIEMATVYKDHSQTVKVSAPDGSSVTESFVDDVGMQKLADIFERVPIGNRAGVYSVFLEKLNDLGLGASIEQFKGTVH